MVTVSGLLRPFLYMVSVLSLRSTATAFVSANCLPGGVDAKDFRAASTLLIVSIAAFCTMRFFAFFFMCKADFATASASVNVD